MQQFKNGAPSVSDSEMIASVLSGSREQFRPLMERHQQSIFGYLYRLLNRDRDTAQDLTQTVFLKAYQSLASFDRSRPFPPWLYRIAHNEAANHLRSLSRRGETGIEDTAWGELAAPANSSPEAIQSKEDDRRMVTRALGKIKPKYREALMLYYYEEKSYEEIAEILNKNISTVGTLIRRARHQMQTILETQGESFSPR